MKASIAWLGLAIALYASNVVAQDRRIQGDNTFGCESREYYDKLTSFIASGDMAAFKKGYVAGIVAGQCVAFNAGDSVIVEDTAMFAGLIKIRVRGETTGYWTHINVTE